MSGVRRELSQTKRPKGKRFEWTRERALAQQQQSSVGLLRDRRIFVFTPRPPLRVYS